MTPFVSIVLDTLFPIYNFGLIAKRDVYVKKIGEYVYGKREYKYTWQKWNIVWGVNIRQIRNIFEAMD